MTKDVIMFIFYIFCHLLPEAKLITVVILNKLLKFDHDEYKRTIKYDRSKKSHEI